MLCNYGLETHYNLWDHAIKLSISDILPWDCLVNTLNACQFKLIPLIPLKKVANSPACEGMLNTLQLWDFHMKLHVRGNPDVAVSFMEQWYQIVSPLFRGWHKAQFVQPLSHWARKPGSILTSNPVYFWFTHILHVNQWVSSWFPPHPKDIQVDRL